MKLFKNNPMLIIGIIYIIGMVILSAFSVGKLPDKCNEPFSWWLPLEVFLVTASSAVAFGLGGIKYGEEKEKEKHEKGVGRNIRP